MCLCVLCSVYMCIYFSVCFAVVQSLSYIQLFMTAAHEPSLSFSIFQSLLKLMFFESVMPSKHLILLSSSLPALNLSQHQGLFSESVLLIRWPKYWSFNFSISPSSEYSRLISVRIDWFDLFVVQEILKNLQVLLWKTFWNVWILNHYSKQYWVEQYFVTGHFVKDVTAYWVN